MILAQGSRESPLVLIDDVLHEMDEDTGDRLLGWLEKRAQLIIASKDAETYKRCLSGARVLNVRGGMIEIAHAA